MRRRPPRHTSTDPLLPYRTLFRAPGAVAATDQPDAVAAPLCAFVVEPLTGFARLVVYSTAASIKPGRPIFALILIVLLAILESSPWRDRSPDCSTTANTDVQIGRAHV